MIGEPRTSVLIVDDEPPAVERLSAMVAGLERFEVAGCESRSGRVLERCRELAPDAVLLDVEMPGMDGLQLASALLGEPGAPAVIFVTAHDRYAVEAFDVEAVDYLVKPVRTARLRQALERVTAARGQRSPGLAARIGDRLVRIPVDDIRAFTAEDKCTVVHALRTQALVDQPLKAVERDFGERFVRIHRNALASREHIRALFSDRSDIVRVEIDGIDLVPEVSRRNQKTVRKLLTEMSEQSRTKG